MKSIPLIAVGLGLGACVAAPPPAHVTASADPSIGLRSAGYAPVTAGLRNYDVVEPLDWRELNRRVTPGAAPARDGRDDASRGNR